MVSLPQSKKPKFLFTLEIQELANIPKVSGSCFVKWHIKDTTSQQFKGSTSKSHIHHYRANWDYNYETLLKIPISSRNKLLHEKVLVMIVYVEFSDHPHLNGINANIHQTFNKIDDKIPLKVDKRIKLGKVEINLSEYANYEEPLSNRYLLQDSKVNCILNVKIGMELLKGDKTDFVAPSIKSSNIFKGITNVFNESINESSTAPSSAGASHHRANSGSGISSTERFHKSVAITSDPIVSKLYEKTFEISWDPRPGELTAAECIDDIFNGGDGWAKNEEGINLIDLQIEANGTSNPLFQMHDINGDATRPVKESDVREELKSWAVHHTHP